MRCQSRSGTSQRKIRDGMLRTRKSHGIHEADVRGGRSRDQAGSRRGAAYQVADDPPGKAHVTPCAVRGHASRRVTGGSGSPPGARPAQSGLGRVSKSASLLHGQRLCPDARRGSALKSFRPYLPRLVRSRECFHCWEPTRLACGLPGSFPRLRAGFVHGMSCQ
jgi:hypothetical protein